MQVLNYYLKKQKNVYILCVKLWGGGGESIEYTKELYVVFSK